MGIAPFTGTALDLQWLIAGDFNEILWSHEKNWGCQRRRCLMQAFRSSLLDSHLDYLGYSSVKFKWEKFVTGSHYVQERLDRVLALAP